MIPVTFIFGWPPPSVGEGKTLSEAPLLTEADLIVVEPTFASLAHSYSEPHWKAVVGNPVPGHWLSTLSRRHHELTRFLARGGVVAAFLGAPSSAFVHKHSRLFALEFIVGTGKAMEMGIEEARGTTYQIFDQQSPLASYLYRRPRWMATMQQGVLAPDPFGHALATSQDGSIIAYQEIVGPGVVLWVPAPEKEEHWPSLLVGAETIWRQRQDVAGEVAVAEERALLAEIEELDGNYHRERGKLGQKREQLRSSRLTFLVADSAVDRARRLYRAAQTYGPVKELDTYFQMLEVIEQQYGGEAGAQAALGYSGALAAKISGPANQRRFAVRHPGQDAPEPLPTDLMDKARTAAREILRLFVDHRFAEWRVQTQQQASQ